MAIAGRCPGTGLIGFGSPTEDGLSVSSVVINKPFSFSSLAESPARPSLFSITWVFLYVLLDSRLVCALAA
jgi:hypothetical protein